MVIKTTKEIIRERLIELSEAARLRFRDAVLPIYGATDQGEPTHIGSAILVDIAEGCFLLTAAHVIDWNKSTSLFIGANGFLELKQEVLISVAPGGDRSNDHVDFAIAPLGGDLLAKLANMRSVQETEISQYYGDTNLRTYACLGYPNSKNKVNAYKGAKVVPSLGLYTSLGRPAAKLPGIANNTDHVLVDYNAKYSRDDTGQRVNTISLHGFSGGAIIDVGTVTLDNLTEEPDPKLFGLIIEAHSTEKVILGTKLSTILFAARKSLP